MADISKINVNGSIKNIKDSTARTAISGKVTGPSSATANHIATYDGTTGKVIKDSGFTIGKSVPSDAVFTDTTYESKSAASDGTDVSLVTTGEKYTWNHKSNLTIGTTSSTAAAGNHTHNISLATDSGTATVTLAHNTTYKLTAGGNSIIFKTPPAAAASVSGTTLTIG